MDLSKLDLVISNLESNRWSLPVSKLLLRESFNNEECIHWENVFSEYEQLGFNQAQIIFSLGMIRNQTLKNTRTENHQPELVWTGPEALNSTLRDTSIVAQELFREAQNEVIIVGFAFYQGKEIFKKLALKLDSDPHFKVSFFVDVRRDGNTSVAEAILLKFKTDFKKRQWPGLKLPEIYYDPRTLDLIEPLKSSMHAKCILVDACKTLVTSANFTQAAHHRNIEVGILIDSKNYAINLKSQFFNLVESGFFKQI